MRHVEVKPPSWWARFTVCEGSLGTFRCDLAALHHLDGERGDSDLKFSATVKPRCSSARYPSGFGRDPWDAREPGMGKSEPSGDFLPLQLEGGAFLQQVTRARMLVSAFTGARGPSPSTSADSSRSEDAEKPSLSRRKPS